MEYQLILSKRKTISIKVTSDLKIIVRAPKGTSQKTINRFITQNLDWIEASKEKIKKANEHRTVPTSSTQEEIKKYTEMAKKDIPARVEHFAPIVGVDYENITIRNQKTRWGSCSSKGNLNFNCRLMLAPEKVRDYVVIHELCHRLQMNHSKQFWNEVERVMPDYKVWRKWLHDNADALS